MKHAVIILLMIFLGMPGPAKAKQEIVRLSSAEDVALAFYKTAGFAPDFRRWIWERPPFKTTPLARRSRIFQEEKERLQRAFQGFNKSRDRLILRAPVDINPRALLDRYFMGLTFKGLDQRHYVSVPFLDQNFALFPFNLDRLMDSAIDPSLYEALNNLNSKQGQPFILLVMRAAEADISQPISLEGKSQWVFKTKIETITLYQDEETALWVYNAPVDLSLR